jgi:biotin carboxylase
MPTVVVLLPSTTYRAGDFVAAANALDLDIIVASEQAPPFNMGDRYIQVDCSDPEKAAASIVELGDHAAIDGVVAADDAGVVAAALVADELGLRGNDPGAAKATRDKGLMRERLARSEVPQPMFGVIGADDDPAAAAEEIGYPLVVKPLDRSAGQGVIRVNHSGELTPAISRTRRIVGEDAGILLEEFMPGPEVVVEGIVSAGDLVTLALFDKPDATEGPYFEETILVTPSALPMQTQRECQRIAESSLRGLGISHGPVHVELKVSGTRVRVVEVAARSIGGLCSKSLRFGLTGTTLESLILRNALGRDKAELRRETGASGVLMIPIPSAGVLAGISGVDEVEELSAVDSIEITARPGSQIAPPPEGDHYLGFVFASAATAGEVTDVLRKSVELLRVDIE